MKYLNKITAIVFWSVCLWLLIRIFFFQAFHVPTASMYTALKEGDYILVNKLAYGARIPITPLSVHIGNQKHFLDWIRVPYMRLPGYSSVAHNDIVVFNLPTEDLYPTDEKKEYVKRCIGLPGDVVSIQQGAVFINEKSIQEPRTQLNWYTVTTNNRTIDSTTKDLFLTAQSADSLIRCGNIITVSKKHIPASDYSPAFFPNSPQIKWNPDHFGPFYIPKRGQSVPLNKRNLLLYQRVIEVYEGNTLTVKGDSVFVNNTYERSYTFKMSYYFMLGDNRYNSIDSRYWGVVPEDHLIGKSTGTLFSSSKTSL